MLICQVTLMQAIENSVQVAADLPRVDLFHRRDLVLLLAIAPGLEHALAALLQVERAW